MENNKINDDMISLSDIVIMFIKNFKIWLGVFLVCFAFIFVFIFSKSDTYIYKQDLNFPHYISNGTQHNIISLDIAKIAFNYQNYLNKVDKNNAVIVHKKNSTYIKLENKLNKKDSVLNIFHQNLAQLSSIKIIESTVDNWKKNIAYQNQILKFKINQYSVLNKKNHTEFIKNLKININTDAYNIVASYYLKKEIDYQKIIFNLENDIKINNNNLKSLQPNFTYYGKMTVTKKSLSKELLIIIGLIVSIVLALIAVLIKEFISGIKTKIRDKSKS